MSLSSQAPADAVPRNWVEAAPRAFRPYLQLMRMDRPIGSWLLFWPCVCGLALGAMAEERSFTDWRDLYYVVLFGIGTVVMRGAGCTFNDIIDRKIDAQVARTRGRPIPSGAVSVTTATIFMALLALVGLVILLQFNRFAVILGAASLLLVAAYPFMKRITWWPQAWLGLTFNWGALLGFAAGTGHVDLPDLFLYAGLFFWTLGYDTIYALQDREDDALIGVRSTALLFGDAVPVWVTGFYLATLVLLLVGGLAAGKGILFVLGLFLVAWLLLRQVAGLRSATPAECLRRFRANRDVGLAVFAALLLGSLG